MTTKDCSHEEVMVYDTLYDNIDCTTKKMLEGLFNCGKEACLSCKMANGIQKQQGVVDCSFFAIAFVVSLAYEACSPTPRFEQSKLWSHLITCMEAQYFTIFPDH